MKETIIDPRTAVFASKLMSLIIYCTLLGVFEPLRYNKKDRRIEKILSMRNSTEEISPFLFAIQTQQVADYDI